MRYPFRRSFISKTLLCFLLLALIGGGASSAYASDHGGGGHGGESKPADKGGEDSGEGVTGGKFDGDPVYVRLQPIIFPIISDRGAEQIVTLIVHLQTKDFDTATSMHERMPKLKDSILQALYGGLSDGKMRNSYMLDLEKIKSNIKNTVNRIFGEGSVVDVLVQAVGQRKL